MTRDQYQHNRTFTQIQWNGCHYGYSEQVYKDDLVKGNNDEYFFRSNSQDLYRIPRKILSDRGPQFALKFIEELIKALRTTRQLSMVYHPQTDR